MDLRGGLERLLRIVDVRRSFRAKVLVSLLACVSVVAGVAYVLVRAETRQQVEEVARRAAERTRLAAAEVEELRRAELARLADLFTGSPRSLAILEAALQAGSSESRSLLIQDLQYELLRQELEGSLAAFTDAEGDPVFTVLDGEEADEPDPAGVERLARSLLEENRTEMVAYRTVRGRLYMVRVIPLQRGGYVLGTVALGVPVAPSAPERIGDIVGAEVCFVVGGRCRVGTPEEGSELRRRMVAVTAGAGPGVRRVGGTRWSFLSEPLSPDWTSGGRRVVAVPLDRVLAPFERIARALRITGLGALLLAVAVGMVLSRGLTRPVEALMEAASKIGEGRYDTRVDIESRDEVGRLGRAFNSMAEGLQLKERYRGVLDKVVSREVAEELLRGEVVLGGENREVTTLFADVAGFTELSEGKEPQEVIELLNECMARLSAAIEAERGVVDKYVGDEVMAIFGAPVAHGNDALRAVRAALRMQEAMEELNRERTRRGVDPVEVSIGINTGVAVAGNMGSPERMNYTVLGESVNLAARACGAAGGGEILVTGRTRDRVAGAVEVRSGGARTLKGFSRRVELFRVEGETGGSGDSGNEGGAAGARPDRGGTALLLALLVAAFPAGLGAQEGDGPIPTLADLGAEYVSGSGYLQVGLSGRADLELYRPDRAPPWLIPETDAFVAGRARLFTDVFVGQRVYGLLELRADRGEAPRAGPLSVRAEQLFVRVRPFAERSLALQVGKMVSPVGGYPLRHHTEADPFIRPPPPYDVRTVVSSSMVPPDVAAFLGWKSDPGSFRSTGSPPVWGAPYPWGILASGRLGPVVVQGAVLNSAPSAEPESWGLDDPFGRAPNLAARASVQPLAELRLSASWSRGPYLSDEVSGPLPAGRQPGDYVQEIGGLEAVFKRGRVVVRSEVFLDRWEVPNVGPGVTDWSWYLEGSVRPRAGLTVAARYGRILFGSPEAASPGSGYTGGGRDGPAWDRDFSRLQLAVGYRLARNLGVRAEYDLNWTAGPDDPDDDLAALQLWWSY